MFQLNNAFKICLQIFILWVIFQLGSWVVAITHIPIPGNVLGMLILFGLLCTGIIKEEWLALGSNLLLKHLAFFFIPIAVGLMEWGGLFKTYGLWLLGALTVSALLALLTTGGLVQTLTKSGTNPKVQAEETKA